jgi:hypothetical protein
MLLAVVGGQNCVVGARLYVLYLVLALTICCAGDCWIYPHFVPARCGIESWPPSSCPFLSEKATASGCYPTKGEAVAGNNRKSQAQKKLQRTLGLSRQIAHKSRQGLLIGQVVERRRDQRGISEMASWHHEPMQGTAGPGMGIALWCWLSNRKQKRSLVLRCVISEQGKL